MRTTTKTSPHPQIPIPWNDWLGLQDMAAEEGMGDTNLMLHTTCLLNMARYMHCLHYKIDGLQQSMKEVSLQQTPDQAQDALRKKYSWLSQCDDHVFKLPPVDKAMDLAWTAPVIACVLAYDVSVST